MSESTTIQWTDSTWNPVTGCTKVSPGCKHCYAETFAERWRGIPGHPYEQGFDLRLWPERLELPLRWRKPRMIFVNSMSDLFHERVPDAYIHRVFDVMWRAGWHTFQVLTKRAGRVAAMAPSLVWPSNVWMGVSVEDQERADERIPHLLHVPAAVRWLSVEPMLGPVDLMMLDGLHWVVIGGESGPCARPMELDWAQSLIRQCRAERVPVFVKQLGGAWARANHARHHKGGDPSEWPEDLRVREYPT